MKQTIATVALVVRDYEEAIRWYTEVLGFELIEDKTMGPGKRWVRVMPRGSSGPALLLAVAKGDEQVAAIGRQGGGRVFLFLETDDFDRDHARMKAAGARFLEDARTEAYGKVVVFEDLYGNRWDLIERFA